MEELRAFLCSLEQLYTNHYVSYTELKEFVFKNLPDILRPQKDSQKDPQKDSQKHFQKIKITNLKLKSLLKLNFKKYHLLNKIDFYLNHREKANQNFIKNAQTKKIQVEGNLLDQDQIRAVVACEDAELILASAGSGKSASLMAKVDYIINELKIPADRVLVIAFTRKVVKELNERMGSSGAEICTFHSFGNKIIKNLSIGQELKLVPDGFLEKTIEKILNSWVKNDKLTSEDIKEFGDLESLKKLLISTLNLQKNEQISLKEFKNRIEKMSNIDDKKRAENFYPLHAKAVQIYGKILREHKLYDFSDMLSWATRIIKKLPKGALKYQYILVDEVQDLSRSKSLLLKAIIENCQKTKLFAVGDDWQSIYRFAGSNLGVIKDFEKTFGLVTYRGVIRKTYRFGQPTAWVSEYFIRKNPHQSKKKVQTFKKTKTPIEICLNCPTKVSTIPPDYQAVNQKLQELYQKIGKELFKKRVQIISRYNHDIYRLVDFKNHFFENAKIADEKEDGVILDWNIEKANQKIKVNFCSMHKSKGITRDIVFVINMNSGEKGMPSTRTDEPILATMLAKPDPFPLAEERRLFYVAITRATELTIIISERQKISAFVKEIAKNLDSETFDSII